MTKKNKDRIEDKLEKDIENLLDDFGDDYDKLIEEDIAFRENRKPKKKLDYPESFNKHWRKKVYNFIKSKLKEEEEE